MASDIRIWYIDQALYSVESLIKILPTLTEKEVLKCLELESASMRRKSVLRRLIGRAARLRELEYVQQLKERYLHGTG